jgi:hypothetical protein
LREADDKLRREGLADDPADSADAYLERIHGAGREDNRVSGAGSPEKDLAADRTFRLTATGRLF